MVDEILSSVEVVPFLPAHAPWVLATFWRQLLRAEGVDADQAMQYADALARALRGPARVYVATPRGYTDDAVGWAAGVGGAVVFAYVRRDFRRHGIATQLAGCLTERPPVRLAFWTDAADAIQVHGFPVEYDIHAFREFLRYVRPSSHRFPTRKEAA